MGQLLLGGHPGAWASQDRPSFLASASLRLSAWVNLGQSDQWKEQEVHMVDRGDSVLPTCPLPSSAHTGSLGSQASSSASATSHCTVHLVPWEGQHGLPQVKLSDLLPELFNSMLRLCLSDDLLFLLLETSSRARVLAYQDISPGPSSSPREARTAGPSPLLLTR